MGYRSVLVGRVWVFEWQGQPSQEDFDRAQREVRGHYDRLGKLQQIVVIRDSVRAPDTEGRKRASADTLKMLSRELSLMHVAIFGEGVMAALFRSIIRGMLLLVPKPERDRILVHGSVNEVLASLRLQGPFDETAVRNALLDQSALLDSAGRV